MHVQIGYFFTIFASKKMPCFLVVNYCPKINKQIECPSVFKHYVEMTHCNLSQINEIVISLS
jgi:hypothetical protein